MAAFGDANPLFATTYDWAWGTDKSEAVAKRMAQAQVYGPVLINTLAAAYLVPALVLVLGALRLSTIDRRIRIVLAGLGGVLAIMWGFAVIRHFW